MAEVLNEVRRLIEESGETRYAISKATGITQVQLCRLMAGDVGLSLDRLEALLQHLGYQIKLQKRR
jgi:predicted XRE-type DNA-binding protein